jgi:hypothetical protein
MIAKHEGARLLDFEIVSGLPPVVDHLIRFYGWWDNKPDARVSHATAVGYILKRHGFDLRDQLSQDIIVGARAMTNPVAQFGAENTYAINELLLARQADADMVFTISELAVNKALDDTIAALEHPLLGDSLPLSESGGDSLAESTAYFAALDRFSGFLLEQTPLR